MNEFEKYVLIFIILMAHTLYHDFHDCKIPFISCSITENANP